MMMVANVPSLTPGQAHFTVWMPETPLELDIPDDNLSQIQSWKIPNSIEKWVGSPESNKYNWDFLLYTIQITQYRVDTALLVLLYCSENMLQNFPDLFTIENKI